MNELWTKKNEYPLAKINFRQNFVKTAGTPIKAVTGQWRWPMLSSPSAGAFSNEGNLNPTFNDDSQLLPPVNILPRIHNPLSNMVINPTYLAQRTRSCKLNLPVPTMSNPMSLMLNLSLSQR